MTPSRLLLSVTSAALVACAALGAGSPALAAPSAPSLPATAAEPATPGTEVEPAALPATGVSRIGGDTRYDVSASIAANTAFPALPVKVAYVVSGEVFPDALSASALAGELGGPVLLVSKSAISAQVTTQLSMLKPKKIVVLGGPNTIDAQVVEDLGAYSGKVERVGGADRYEVSAEASEKVFEVDPMGPGVDAVYVASGESFPDALSGSAAAATKTAPVLLTQKDQLPTAVEAEIKRLHPKTIVILGGTSTISEKVEASLKAIQPAIFRYNGTDRFATSAAVSKAFDPMIDTVVVSSGRVFPDALSGGPLAIMNLGPLLLVDTNGIPDSIDAELDRLKPKRIVVLGGTSTVSAAVEESLKQYIRP